MTQKWHHVVFVNRLIACFSRKLLSKRSKMASDEIFYTKSLNFCSCFDIVWKKLLNYISNSRKPFSNCKNVRILLFYLTKDNNKILFGKNKSLRILCHIYSQNFQNQRIFHLLWISRNINWFWLLNFLTKNSTPLHPKFQLSSFSRNFSK
jgi:hypothetical protein